jgi:Uncharacterised nucleotidyltransferase
MAFRAGHSGASTGMESMRPGAIPLPPLKRVEAALLKTTEFLARELSLPGREPPQWSEFEWRVAQAVAAMQGISALLSAALKWTGPEHWQAFLAEQKIHTLLRQQRIEALLSRMDSQARDAGIGVVALKGAALLGIGVYPPGMRPMGDIDLFIDSADLNVTARLLTTMGYVESFETRRHKVFVPREARGPVGFGEHVDNPIKIELHSRIARRLPVFETDITSLVFAERSRAGLKNYPSVAALMRHLLLNAAGDMLLRASRLIQVHDIALLAGRMSSVDWKELLEPGAGNRDLWWAFPPLTLTHRYYPAVIPPAVIDALEPDCPWLLRQVSRQQRLANVSLSTVRIQAFPGIEWARSPRETLLFAMSRVWPSREARAETSDALQAEPRLTSVPWYGLSRPRRILHWMFSRPPRVETIVSVRSALGHGLW